MTFAQFIPIVLTVSILLNVLSLGMEADLADATYLFRRPTLLARALLSMNVIMVLIVVAAVAIFEMTFPVEVALLSLAVSPVPPLLPTKEQKLGTSKSYAVGLLVAAVLFSLISIPWSIEWIGGYFDRSTHVSASKIAPIVFVSAIMPLAIGILVHRFLPVIAVKMVRPVRLVSNILLVFGVLSILVTIRAAIWTTIVDGVLVALVCFTLIGLFVGHIFGGPISGDRTALALATASRHPGIALSIASLNFPDQKVAVMAVIICHLLVGAVISIPYIRWRRALHAAGR